MNLEHTNGPSMLVGEENDLDFLDTSVVALHKAAPSGSNDLSGETGSLGTDLCEPMSTSSDSKCYTASLAHRTAKEEQTDGAADSLGPRHSAHVLATYCFLTALMRRRQNHPLAGSAAVNAALDFNADTLRRRILDLCQPALR